MGTPDNKLSELVDLVKSWIPRRSEALTISRDFWMPDQSCSVCYECDSQFTVFNRRHHCRICGRVFCARCTSNSIPAPSDELQTSQEDSEKIRVCTYCFKQWEQGVETVDNGVKLHTPVLSPSPSATSLASTQSSCTGNSGTSTIGSTPYSTGPYQRIPHTSVHSPIHAKQMDLTALDIDDVTQQRSMQHYTDFVDPSSDPYNFCISRSDDEDDYAVLPSHSESRQYGILGVDAIDHTYGPYDCRPNGDSTDGKEVSCSPSADSYVTQGIDGAKELRGGVGEHVHGLDNGSPKDNQEEMDAEPVEFESSGLLWLPPEPEDEEDEKETAIFDDDDDDGKGTAGEWGYLSSSNSFNCEEFRNKDKSNEEHKKAMKNVVEGHFRALIAQLLQAENLPVSGTNGKGNWLDIISSLSWEAATLLKPDTSKGGGMDPGGYVKVKCIASGNRDESKVVKGVVCKKNVAHRRMTTKIEKPRLLILGGALEYQRVATHLSSFDTLLQQEKDHLKMAVAKIDAHHPNVLLVEKSVSRHAQEYLLAKDISLVLNIKRPLLERIARCTGAQIVSSIDHLNSPKLGCCETFHVDRFLEEHGSAGQGGKKLTKTLMFFEGCPKPLAYTILLKGANGDELKKVKHVVQYGLFAAYHLALETSFLADEGASLPELPLKTVITVALPDKPSGTERSISMIPGFHVNSQGQATHSQPYGDSQSKDPQLDRSASGKVPPSDALEGTKLRSFPEIHRPENAHKDFALSYMNSEISFQSSSESGQDQFYFNDGALLANNAFDGNDGVDPGESYQERLANKMEDWKDDNATTKAFCNSGSPGGGAGNGHGIVLSSTGNSELSAVKEDGNNLNGEVGSLEEEFPPSSADHQSILVSLSTRCVWKGTVCKRAHLLRIKYYSNSDRPLGRFLRDELFDQNYHCCSCDMPSEAHVHCYTHRQGSLTISVRKLPEIVLPGQREGKIWMWHRCLRCPRKSGLPQATRRVVMSDAAWGLSFGKFLELSFSNHAAASRVASCGHSLHRDCLRFYGFANMVACFSYASIDLNSVYLPPPKLEFNYDNQGWIQKEANEVHEQAELLFSEVLNVIHSVMKTLTTAESQEGGAKAADIKLYIEELEKMLLKEREEFEEYYRKAVSRGAKVGQPAIDILEINSLRRLLLVHSYVCDQRLIHAFNSASNYRQELNNSVVKSKDKTISSVETLVETKAGSDPAKSFSINDASLPEKNSSTNPASKIGTTRDLEQDLNSMEAAGVFLSASESNYKTEPQLSGKIVRRAFSDGEFPVMTDLSDTLDAAWTGDGHPPILTSGEQAALAPLEGKTEKEAPNALQSGRDAVIRATTLPSKGLQNANCPNDVNLAFPNFYSSFSSSSLNPQKLGIGEYNPVYVQSFWESERLSGARLLLPVGYNDTVVPIYDDEPTSIISYALVSSDYYAQISNAERPKDIPGSSNSLPLFDSMNLLSLNSFSEATWDSQRSFGSSDESNFSSSGSRIQQADPLLTIGDFHARVTFTDDCFLGKAKYVVTCYYAKHFEALRRICCPSELDFVRSLSRCKKWGAQGGKSNVFFAKTLDERFIIKQVTKTELESFIKFAPAYFKYLSNSISSGSPTCLAKILGIYQVSSKHMKGGRESKMDVLVMENLLFRRNITRLYDLKGSSRSRYNADTTGNNKVLLDQNLIEAMPTSPIFVGNKAKRLLERAVWNDTSFLASVDVMDYSLLVGVDEEKHELVLGIIDFMRQYTWDKHLETWVKTSGILGGSRNTTPTVISPQMYKRRFRKAMTTYFLMVPEWSPPAIIPSHSQTDLCEDNSESGKRIDQ